MERKTAQAKRRITRHFKERDPRVHKVLADMNWDILRPAAKPAGYFQRLCREIVAQQLGSGAAAAILRRFRALFPGGRPTPDRVLALPEERLRATGMAWAKARSIRDLAWCIRIREVNFVRFSEAADEEVIAELVKVKGIGRWTAEMFLIFTLGREDVFSHGDLALQKGLRHVYGERRTQSQASRAAIVAAWSPFRSYGSLALWNVMDNTK